ncbi:hypothetical protein FHS04_002093 [Mesoflavibacter sabulilitoris]|uniref:DUF4252 domain-containing protein n=1 Tax=Mesoflavibacter zeaxanthinifaciens subsp. sabulilitoris TaxID=1520893 RepID=A0A2T1NM38_9FLAO|nr:YbjN domain-containing protein [Mesoflavibacter zeaxanthinifaciens]MBB3124570.1 hypothetical protein [Mesoflavibacter zeaxanthinifaciens subsp. sabulilitoris]PSG93936.1 hypothetical protein C7H61_01820 [Mesoflavibacter zeaxanthinifaciens subsp. sabulilitoris]|tara:strand:+ start:894 stop:1367 length:474 start_codon:yes stop_codon:yes gene_type:complete
MKTLKQLMLLFLMCIATQTFAQGQLSSPDNVTPKYLETIFENAYMDVLDVKDTFIKIKDSQTMYLDIDPKQRYISINSVYTVKKGAKKDEILEVFNTVNKEVIMIKCYYNESAHTVSFYYYFWIDNGFSDKTFVSAVKLFQSGVTLALQKDVNKTVF